jgi:hypothetical protein
MPAKPAKSTAALPTPENLQGLAVDAADRVVLQEAIELAVSYRGDVTIERRSHPTPLEGYIFDQQIEKASGEIVIRLIPKDSDDRIRVRFSDIAALRFTGKDTASGKTFENWIKKYAEKKLAGEAANIESESLD